MKSCCQVFLLMFCSLLTSCNWSDTKREKFVADCEKTKTTSELYLMIVGFEDNEIDSLTVKEYDNGVVVEEFVVKVPPLEDYQKWEKERKTRYVSIIRTINVDHQYHFIIPNQKTFKVEKMQMLPWAQYTMFSEGWGCRLVAQEIDGKEVKNESNFILSKNPR